MLGEHLKVKALDDVENRLGTHSGLEHARGPVLKISELGIGEQLHREELLDRVLPLLHTVLDRLHLVVHAAHDGIDLSVRRGPHFVLGAVDLNFNLSNLFRPIFRGEKFVKHEICDALMLVGIELLELGGDSPFDFDLLLLASVRHAIRRRGHVFLDPLNRAQPRFFINGNRDVRSEVQDLFKVAR